MHDPHLERVRDKTGLVQSSYDGIMSFLPLLTIAATSVLAVLVNDDQEPSASSIDNEIINGVRILSERNDEKQLLATLAWLVEPNQLAKLSLDKVVVIRPCSIGCDLPPITSELSKILERLILDSTTTKEARTLAFLIVVDLSVRDGLDMVKFQQPLLKVLTHELLEYALNVEARTDRIVLLLSRLVQNDHGILNHLTIDEVRRILTIGLSSSSPSIIRFGLNLLPTEKKKECIIELTPELVQIQSIGLRSSEMFDYATTYSAFLPTEDSTHDQWLDCALTAQGLLSGEV